MRVLAIDTATDAATVAVVEDNIVVGEYVINHKKTHSQKIMVMIDRVLTDLELKVSDIDVFAVATGPGSFTGLRIGVATIKALAHSHNKPTVGVNTLYALAYNICDSNKVIVPIMDARRGQVFNAAYKWNNGVLETVVEPNACDIHECIERVSGYDTIFTGDGVNVHCDLLKTEVAPVHLRMSKASAVCVCAYQMAERGCLSDYNSLVPEYLRLSQAEQELLKKSKTEDK